MKNIRFYKTIKPAVSCVRISAAGVLLLGAAALAAIAVNPGPPKLPWAGPTVTISEVDAPGSAVFGVAVDPATNTIYVASFVVDDQITNNAITVIDGRRCSATNASHCTPLARMTNVGPAPMWLTVDPSTHTLYVTNGQTPDYEENNTITVLNTSTCNANDTSGCGQMPAATFTVPGPLFNNDTNDFSIMALNTSTHTLYIGDAHDGPVSMINTATCNATTTSGCSMIPTTMVNGDGIALENSTHSVYVFDIIDQTASVFDGAHCNSTDQSACNQATTFALPYVPYIADADPITQTLYVTMPSGTEGTLGFVGLVDISACNSTIRSGCGANAPYLVKVGSLRFRRSSIRRQGPFT